MEKQLPLCNLIFLFGTLLICFVISTTSFAQDTVTFEGSITRHQLVDQNETVSGNVYLDFGLDQNGDLKRLSVPFTLPANRNSTNYSAELDWSDVGNEPDSTRDRNYITVSIKCNNNCEKANIQSQTAHYGALGETNRVGESERFGEGSRDNFYRVDLTLLPKFALLRGTYKLPNGAIAKEDIELNTIAFYTEFFGLSINSESFVEPVRIKSGTNSAQFALQIDVDRFLFIKESSFIFGYSCNSPACQRAGLAKRAWFDSDGDTIFTNVNSARNITINKETSADSYLHTVNNAVVLLPNIRKDVTIQRRETEEKSLIRGKLIVEKMQAEIFCGPEVREPINFKSETTFCYVASTQNRSTIIDEMGFEILPGQLSTTLPISLAPMQQTETGALNLDPQPLEELRIRFECYTGCETSRYLKKGFFAGDGRRFSLRNANRRGTFFFDKDHDFDIEVYLNGPLVIEPAIDLIMN